MSFNTSVPVSNALLTKSHTNGFAMFNGVEVITNHWGDSSDGSVTISADTNLVVQNKSGSYDGDMVVKNYGNLTIDAGFTLTTDQPCRGMLLYVNGDLVVNGTISMSARGAYRNPSDVDANGLQIQRFKTGQSDATPTFATSHILSGCGTTAEQVENSQTDIAGAGKVYSIPKVGGSGGTGGTNANGSAGGTSAGTGGGGGGGNEAGGTAGHGKAGTCFGGGTGGGGGVNNSGQSGTDYGGKGGNGQCPTSHQTCGGAGNPGGTGTNGGGTGGDGTGGLLVILVKGDVTIGASGSIVADGSSCPNISSGQASGGGGGSGGGVVLLLHAGAYSNSGTVSANGGAGTDCSGHSQARDGGAGGAGTVTVDSIDV